MVHKLLLPFALLYTFFLTFGSFIEPEQFPKLGRSITDKGIHFMGYAILVFLWSVTVYFNSKKNIFIMVVLKTAFFALVYGIIIEVLQEQLTSNRDGDIMDGFANLLGILFAVILLYFIQPKLIKLKNRN
ncbi:MAG: hypothetical protein COZ75_09865 [Flavobacteriaceae bacterium CG_4_8_14_3_um_filter_34_10]|nr:MAG: hypothetical protein COW66_01865 [Flavobacteriaceae bacterium CG18_big_fil_WC_8_21_14_2_50_34_36]PIV48532.1 MAG: hypothetical protein COS19_13335 [Flavobacteriaceae bacterium CG02_land_8_20_14_3_00_34_13]PIX08837.1 MAG: hypothetical protein COZ75_09865 [Flavobacteriaceae bacterium CG_4_8_14_3_um_filter_34_10]PIZ07282.1 MAG: hypothetical protein COY56_09790 [Flavobacteriaceae bacterium CG_4_10_14_0_8_um_filter_34_31]PJC07989.1 MAG: hypothetical protein CO068_03405 [Flavobacteriaceae bact